MATTSYDKLYLDDASMNIGTMFEYAISFKINPIVFWNMFVTSEVAKQIENGNPKYLVGLSAIDLFNMVLHNNSTNDLTLIPKCFFDKSKFYWAGWALTQYQNYKSISFYNINKVLPIDKVLYLYDTLHEADISKFYEIADECFVKDYNETNLKKIRTAAGLSQSQLASKAEVSIRNIQMYEQRKNDINKAQCDILFRLSKTLGCKIEDLFEI